MGEETLSQSRKRKTVTNEEILAKRARNSDDGESCDEAEDMVNELVPGKIIRIFLKNFMCHDALEMKFNSMLNFLVGENGSGKSAILTAITVGLGARAKETDRGSYLKNFVKHGKTSATIEITLTNRGDKNYKWETYGDTITVVRTIGTSSGYKIKSYTGETISTSKQELLEITKTFNIQVDNPIAILSQDAARSFLTTNKPEDLYKFYMKASRLDILKENISISLESSYLSHSKLDDTKKCLRESEKIITELKKRIRALESLDTNKNEHEELQKEIVWAEVIEEEKKLLQIDKKIDHQNKEMEKLENIESTKASKEQEINSQIEELKVQIAKIQETAQSSVVKSERLKESVMKYKKLVGEQQAKTYKFHKNIKEKKRDLEILEQEIKMREQEECNLDVKRQEAQRQIEEFEQQLSEVEATLRTKQTDLLHLEENRSRIDQEDRNLKYEIDQKRMELNKKKQKLHNFERQPNDALAVYGQNFPRLVRRIEEEHQRGRFNKKPVGPLGSFISIKERRWIPAIEAHLGPNLLKSFCVDNHQDKTILNRIMTEIFTNEAPPSIITSRFHNQIHDVSRNSTRSARYKNILEMLVISDVTVANTLIDQKEIERVVLIPTSEEACHVMESASRVPQNCKRAITLVNDLFYPDPDYKSYGGFAKRAHFLQVSTIDAIQALKDEMSEIENQIHSQTQLYSEIQQRKARTYQEHSQVQQLVRKLVGHQSTLKKDIEENKEVLESHSNNVINEHKYEVERIKEWLEKNKEQEAQMMNEYRSLDKEHKTAKKDFQECLQLIAKLEETSRPMKEKIGELKDELNTLDIDNRGAAKKLQEAKQVLQRLKGEHQQQQRAVTTITANASCPRIESTKTVVEIRARIKELSKLITEVEKLFGKKDDLKEELKVQLAKQDVLYQLGRSLQILIDNVNKTLSIRKKLFRDMKKEVANKVKSAFSNILLLRKYKGEVHVDHVKKTVRLEMAPINDAERLSNSAKQLSGGERSYSTISFILALWHCTGLPFYFLDEFDVFMDKVNRRMILDILIHHAQSNPQSQYTILTPLDASHIKVCSTITIHRMYPPDRLG